MNELVNEWVNKLLDIQQEGIIVEFKHELKIKN